MRRSALSGHLPSAAGEGGRAEPVRRFAVSLATCGESAFPALWRGPGVGCLSRGHQPRAGWRFRPLVLPVGLEPPTLRLKAPALPSKLRQHISGGPAARSYTL